MAKIMMPLNYYSPRRTSKDSICTEFKALASANENKKAA
jgi:hypothetical protein